MNNNADESNMPPWMGGPNKFKKSITNSIPYSGGNDSRNPVTSRILEEAKKSGYGPRDKPLSSGVDHMSVDRNRGYNSYGPHAGISSTFPKRNFSKDGKYSRGYVRHSTPTGSFVTSRRSDDLSPIKGFSNYSSNSNDINYKHRNDFVDNRTSRLSKKDVCCKFFLRGDCHLGNSCPYLHNENGNRECYGVNESFNGSYGAHKSKSGHSPDKKSVYVRPFGRIQRP